MAARRTADIRNVVLLGHGGSGKTTLAEALLHQAGAIPRVGRVEDGNTTSDHDPEERERGFSVGLSVLPFDWKGHRVNLIDTPGYADFVGEVCAAVRVADMAVLVVNAVEGLEVQTLEAWRLAAEAGLPRMVFVNKLDRERASFDRTLGELRGQFGAGIAPLELPIGEERDFRGVADLLSETAWTYTDGVAEHGPVPEEMSQGEHEVHDNLVEGIVVADEAMMERYLEGDVPSYEELERAMAVGVDDATVFPVVCGSATARVGIDRLADFICEIGPSPMDRPAVEVAAGDATVEVVPDATGQPLAFVFKTVADQFVGHINLFRVLSGTIRADDHLVNPRTGHDERLHSLMSVRGRESETVGEVVAGDIAAVAKLHDTVTGDTLAPNGSPVRVSGIDFPAPLVAVAIAAATQSDDDRLGEALHRLVEEDPSLSVGRDEETHQSVLRCQGDVHLSVALHRLETKYSVAVTTSEVRVPYRETITAPAEAEGRHKKQSGGHGQFGVCTIRVEPLERGAGFEFVDRIVGGAISKGYIPAVRKGIEEAMASGGEFGYPVVDLRVELLDGKEHSVDSSEMAFKAAGRLALRAAVAEAGPVLLEPVSAVEVTVPVELQGDVMGDLNSRRGRTTASQTTPGGWQVISALVPTGELSHYASELRSLTGGRGRYRAEHDHYDPLPPNLVDSVRRDGER